METCSLDAASATATDGNCAQPSATVCNQVAMAVCLANAAKLVVFGDFKRCEASFRVAGVALVTSQHVTHVASLVENHSVWQDNTSASISENELQFSWQARHFFVACTALQRCCVACLWLIPLSGLREMVSRREFCGSRGILGHVIKIDGSLARNIDFEAA